MIVYGRDVISMYLCVYIIESPVIEEGGWGGAEGVEGLDKLGSSGPLSFPLVPMLGVGESACLPQRLGFRPGFGKGATGVNVGWRIIYS